MVWLVSAQHIKNQIRRKGNLPAGLGLSDLILLNQAGNDCAGAKRPLHQDAFFQPFLQIISQHILI